MRGKWAAGIPPRNFTWIIQDHLAVSERPGGSAPNHRRVRRQEEIIWLRVQGFSRVVSLLPSPHNLAAYDEGEVASSHFPLTPGLETSEVLVDLYFHLDEWLGAGDRVLLHQEELGDRVMGVVAGYLLWCHRLPGGSQAIAVTERLVGRQMGPQGRDVVAEVAVLASAPRRRRRRPRVEELAVEVEGVEEGIEKVEDLTAGVVDARTGAEERATAAVAGVGTSSKAVAGAGTSSKAEAEPAPKNPKRPERSRQSTKTKRPEAVDPEMSSFEASAENGAPPGDQPPAGAGDLVGHSDVASESLGDVGA